MKSLGELWIRPASTGATIGIGEPAEMIPSNTAAIHAHVRHDAEGRYRPLSGAKGLPTGWMVETSPGLALEDAIEAVYPLATIHRKQHAAGTLRVVGLDDVLSRQTGRYEGAARLSENGRTLATTVLCREQCVRVPVWAGEPCDDSAIPCPEPCSVFVSLAREAALWEQELPEPTAINDSIEFAAFEEPGNEIRETYLRRMAGVGAPE